MGIWGSYNISVISAFASHRFANVVKEEDVELEAQLPLVPSTEEEEEVHRIAHALFGADGITKLHLSWLSCYRIHLHHQISTVGGKLMQPVLSALVTDGHDADSGHCIQFMCDICNIICDYGGSPSIDDTLQQWLRKSGRDLVTLDATLVKSARIAVFCVVAWATLLVRISPNATGNAFEIIAHEGRLHLQAAQSLESAKRPISALLRAFCRSGLVPGINNSNNVESGREDSIHVTVVNYSMLLEFGRVKIEWTEDLSSHLVFVPATRTLFLFRMPTVCALGCVEDGVPPFFDSLRNSRNPGSDSGRKFFYLTESCLGKTGRHENSS
ncbi:hypothetical protein FGRMN_3854 [Fusarium graminum]|nr:hypothetical protein FGRMN_3854 [Fusarium graminum]